MSKTLTQAELIQQKSDMINKLDALLAQLIESSDVQSNKKAALLSYWLNSYIDYIDQEDSFDSTKLKSYKRGDIIKLNFGFNVGSEYGGLHYAIVINKKNDRNSSVLTVIPLTSQKENSTVHPNDVFLGNEIYRSLKLKYDTLSQSLQREREEIEKMGYLLAAMLQLIEQKIKTYDSSDESRKILDEAKEQLEAAKALNSDWEEKRKQNEEASRQLAKIGTEIKRMKVGSIALVDQITTISKMRIYDPRNARGVLSGIRLSPESLDKVNQKLQELYIF